MALSRSASGPGGLSINTGNANTFGASTSQAPAGGGLFGASNTAQSSQPAASGGLFDNAPAQPQQTGTGLFGNTTTSQPQQSGGLFGNTGGIQQQQPPQQPSGGLFGASTTNTQPQQPGGLFGNNTAASQPQQSGGLFGSAPQQQQQQAGGLFGSQQPQPQQQQQMGGLFGSTQQKPAGGLFASMGQPQQQQPSGGGLFGGAQTQQNQGGMFGQQQQQQQQPQNNNTGGGGLFGQSQAKPGGLFGNSLGASTQQSTAPGLTMGQSTSQQTVPGVRVDVSNVKGTTRFNDLEDSLQKEMEACDSMIQQFIGQSKEIRAFIKAHGGGIGQLTNDVAWLQRKYDGVKTTLDEDVVAMVHLKKMIKEDAEIAKMGFRGADQLKLPAHYHQTFLSRSTPSGTGGSNGQEPNLEDVLTLFSKEADRLTETHKFQVQKVKEMEQHMPGVEHGLYERVRNLRDKTQMPQFNMVLEMLETIKIMGDKIYEAASGIVDVREQLSTLQRQHPGI